MPSRLMAPAALLQVASICFRIRDPTASVHLSGVSAEPGPDVQAVKSRMQHPHASALQVYGQGGVDSLEIPSFLRDAINGLLGDRGQEGIFIADRTAGTAAAGRRWVPRRGNLRYLPPIDEINASSRDAWATFPGSWGIDQTTASMTDFAVTCLSGLDSDAEELGHTSQSALPFPCFVVRKQIGSDLCA